MKQLETPGGGSHFGGFLYEGPGEKIQGTPPAAPFPGTIKAVASELLLAGLWGWGTVSRLSAIPGPTRNGAR